MAKISINVSIDAELKVKAQELFAELGMDLSTAVNIFLRQTVREQRIPFAVRAKIPNAETIAAIKEFEEFEKHPEDYKRYSSVEELFDDLNE